MFLLDKEVEESKDHEFPPEAKILHYVPRAIHLFLDLLLYDRHHAGRMMVGALKRATGGWGI